MRIDGTYNIGQGGSPETAGALPRPGDAGGRASGAQAAGDLQFESLHQAYIEQARACPEVDAQAVAEATELLRSGKLDSDEFILKAAQELLDQGV